MENILTETGGALLQEDGSKISEDSPIYFALLDGSNVVQQVLAITQSEALSGLFGNPANLVPASYTGAFGGKYPGIGDTYNAGIFS